MLFQRKKKKEAQADRGKKQKKEVRTAPEARAQNEEDLAAQTAASGAGPSSEAQVSKLGPEHPLMQLARKTGTELRGVLRESDLYGGGEEPGCFPEYEDAAVERTKEIDALEADSPDLDASALLWITPDRMHAWLAVFPPAGNGQPVTSELVQGVLSDKGIKYGVQEEAVAQASTPDGYLLLHHVAQGEEARDGENGRVESLIPDLDPSWKKDPNGKINFAEWDWIVNVDAGEKLCEIFPPTEGITGHDVLGREIRAKNGRPAPKVNGKNTSYIEEGRFLQADGSGQLLRLGEKYTVNEVLTIKGDVDYSTGNINSNSSVVINGNIKPNFRVESKQDVVVKGTVEWATIIAGHDLTVTGGVSGGDDDYLEAKNDIRCKFMENGRASCGGDAYFENLVLSDVNAEGSVFVTSGRGSIISGTVTAMNEIKANAIGNRSYRATEVRIGQTPDFAKRLDTCTAELDKARESIRDGNEKIARLSQSGDPKMQSAVSSQKSLVNMAVMKKDNLEGKCEKLLEKARNVKRGKISADVVHPNVTITIGSDSTVIQHEAKYASFFLRNHEIKMGSN